MEDQLKQSKLAKTTETLFLQAKDQKDAMLHLTLSLTSEPKVITLLLYLDVNISLLQARLSQTKGQKQNLTLTKLLQKLTFQAHANQLSTAHGVHVFALIVQFSNLYKSIFDEFGIKPRKIKEYMTLEQEYDTRNINSTKPKALKYCVNLTEKILKNPPIVVGRANEINKIMYALARKDKNNPLLIGEPGTGKTLLVQALAHKLASANPLGKKTVYALKMSELLAGAKYRGDFEQRIESLIVQFTGKKNMILFVDEMHCLIGAGTGNQGSIDAANLLKPILNNGSIQIIGATTHKEYQEIISKDAAFARRLQKIYISEPSSKETFAILQGLAPSFAKYHKIKFSESALHEIISIASKYMPDKFFPDKAIDLLDEAAAMFKLEQTNKKLVDATSIKKAAANILNVPMLELNADKTNILMNLEQNLAKEIFGQEEIIANLAKQVKLSHLGLINVDKPKASYLFCGSTGVGKTALATALSKQLQINMIRFDMSEYSEKHSISGLIGAPNGYEGSKNGGKLTNYIARYPNSILLLDEIEKAHIDIQDILLQILDYGVITDSQGQKVNCKNLIIILTSNLSIFKKQKSIGFSASNDSNYQDDSSVNLFFKPEFRARLDGVFSFNNLTKNCLEKIILSELHNIQNSLSVKNIQLDFSDNVIGYILDNLDSDKGARSIKKTITKHILYPITDKVFNKKALKIKAHVNDAHYLELKEA